MDIIGKLLSKDVSKIKVKTKKLKIKSLSEIVGEDVAITVRELDSDEFADVQGRAVEYNSKGELEEVNINDSQIFTCLYGIVDPNLKDERLQKHYNAASPKDLVIKLLKPGEISKIVEEIRELSGFGEDAVEEVKNESTQTALQG